MQASLHSVRSPAQAQPCRHARHWREELQHGQDSNELGNGAADAPFEQVGPGKEKAVPRVTRSQAQRHSSLAPFAMGCLVQLASARRTLFSNKQRADYLKRLVFYINSVFRTSQGLDDAPPVGWWKQELAIERNAENRDIFTGRPGA